MYIEATAARRQTLHNRVGNKAWSINTNQIVMFRADSKYVVAIDNSGTEHLLDEVDNRNRIKRLEVEFAPEFLRVHRCALVALDSVRSMKRVIPSQDNGRANPYYEVVMDTGNTLRVSRRAIADLRKALAERASPTVGRTWSNNPHQTTALNGI